VTSALSEQVTSYSEAVALLPGDAARALTRLRAFRERWPASPLAHEVALRTIQALVSLGRDSEARQEARTFVMSYPNSPKVADVRELAGVTHE
jgi:outer membrane protein assembly factor BamD (BamD/ComL family)